MDGQLMEVASTQRAQKRHADDNLENEQRLAKRLNALKLSKLVSLACPGLVLT